jgi:hypothetical protein
MLLQWPRNQGRLNSAIGRRAPLSNIVMNKNTIFLVLFAFGVGSLNVPNFGRPARLALLA